MIDFAGIAGKFIGRGASDGAQQGAAGPTVAGENPAGGGFAELVRLAQGETGTAQASLRLVVDPLAIAPIPISPELAVQSQDKDRELTVGAQDPGEEADEKTEPAAPGAPVFLAMAPAIERPVTASAVQQTGEFGKAAAAPRAAAGVMAADVFRKPAPAAPTEDIAPDSLPKLPVESATAPAGISMPQTAAAPEAAQRQPVSPETAAASPRTQPTPSHAAAPVNDRSGDPATGTALPSPPARADEPSRTFTTAGSRSDSGSAPAADTQAAQTSTPLRTIMDGLPPIIQPELSAQPIRVVTGPASGPSTTDALGEQVIDMGVSGQWIDRMAQEIVSLASGTGHSRFTLNPPHLGRVQVDLWQGADSTNVRLMAETDEAAQRLADGRHSLAADARLAALSLGTVTVEKANAPFDSGRDQRQDQRQGGDLSGQAQQNGQSQTQARSGNGGNGNNGNGQGGEWVRRIAPDQPHEASDASARASGSRSASGRVRFA